jgi:hypothetical protein
LGIGRKGGFALAEDIGGGGGIVTIGNLRGVDFTISKIRHAWRRSDNRHRGERPAPILLEEEIGIGTVTIGRIHSVKLSISMRRNKGIGLEFGGKGRWRFRAARAFLEQEIGSIGIVMTAGRIRDKVLNLKE